MHGYDVVGVDMMWSEWHVGDISSLEALEFLTMNSTPERHLSVDGFMDKKREKAASMS